MQVTSMSLAFREAVFALDDRFCYLLNSNRFDEADELADRVALWDKKASECWHDDTKFARESYEAELNDEVEFAKFIN